MSAAASAILALIQLIAPGATTAVIEKIIAALVQLVPLIVQEVRDLAPIVKNIITALRGNGEITSEQLDQLDAMETSLDDAFDKADADAAAADGAPSGGEPTS